MDEVVRSCLLGDLHVVVDDLNINRSDAATQWLLRHPSVQFYDTSTHAS